MGTVTMGGLVVPQLADVIAHAPQSPAAAVVVSQLN